MISSEQSNNALFRLCCFLHFFLLVSAIIEINESLSEFSGVDSSIIFHDNLSSLFKLHFGFAATELF